MLAYAKAKLLAWLVTMLVHCADSRWLHQKAKLTSLARKVKHPSVDLFYLRLPLGFSLKNKNHHVAY